MRRDETVFVWNMASSSVDGHASQNGSLLHEASVSPSHHMYIYIYIYIITRRCLRGKQQVKWKVVCSFKTSFVCACDLVKICLLTEFVYIL
jgi:hypothetical protein